MPLRFVLSNVLALVSNSVSPQELRVCLGVGRGGV